MKKLFIDSRLPQYGLLNLPEYDIKYIHNLDILDNISYTAYKSERDLILYTGINNIIEIDKFKNIKRFYDTLDVVRQHDLDMLLTIEKINIFKVPRWYYSSINVDTKIIELDNKKSFMIKPFLQARSIGKHIFKNKYELYDFIHIFNNTLKIEDVKPKVTEKGYLHEHKGNENTLLYKLFNIDSGDYQTENEQYIMLQHLRDNRYYIQETVDFTHEFRILYFKGTKFNKLIVEDRVGYCPGDSTERKHTICKLNTIIDSDVAKTILKKAVKFGDASGYPALSLDIWFNENTGIYGMFEYSQQFGVAYTNKILKKLSKQYTRAILNSIKEL